MIPRPEPQEYAQWYAGYISGVQGQDPLATMLAQLESTGAMLDAVDDEAAGHRYAPGKWSVREIVGHLSDTERIMSYRALRLARGDTTPLPGFDENDYVAAAGFDARPLPELVREWRDVRRATIALVAGLDPDVLARRGTVSDGPMSVRARIYIIPGHEAHHVEVLRARYGIGGPSRPGSAS